METFASPTCNNSTLAPYVPSAPSPWNLARIKHAYRRISFGTNENEALSNLNISPDSFIERFINSAYNLPSTAAPIWGLYAKKDFSNYDVQNIENLNSWSVQTAKDVLNDDFRGRISMFWMNHFVTQRESYDHAPYMFQYYNILQTYSVGNFREFLRAMGKTPAMLIFLNGFENTKDSPNENYAREFYELFTLGEGNGYTQQDITETARAFTGFNHRVNEGGAITFDVSNHDNGEKTIFGQTGNWGYDSVIDNLFIEKPFEIANHICEKLYKYFVNTEIDDSIRNNIIEPLAQTFVASNFELAPVYKQLFKSEHFFDEAAEAVLIKSPYDVILTFLNESQLFKDDQILNWLIYYCATSLEQDLYNPIDVFGWRGGESWINASTITARWNFLKIYLNEVWHLGHEQEFREFAKNLTNNSSDPEFIIRRIIDLFIPKGLYTANDYDVALQIFKHDIPQNYYDNNIWNLDWDSVPFQVSTLLEHMAKMPEFQLK